MYEAGVEKLHCDGADCARSVTYAARGTPDNWLTVCGDGFRFDLCPSCQRMLNPRALAMLRRSCS